MAGFKCDICGDLFSSTYFLQIHRKRHPRALPHKKHRCHMCAYSTRNVTHLKKHLLTHSGERPHKCPVCTKAFSEQSNLRRHLLIHTGEKPHACPCGKAFTQMTHLRVHMMSHEGKKPYSCPTCGKNFSQEMLLRRHEERMHMASSLGLIAKGRETESP